MPRLQSERHSSSSRQHEFNEDRKQRAWKHRQTIETHGHQVLLCNRLDQKRWDKDRVLPNRRNVGRLLDKAFDRSKVPEISQLYHASETKMTASWSAGVCWTLSKMDTQVDLSSHDMEIIWEDWIDTIRLCKIRKIETTKFRERIGSQSELNLGLHLRKQKISYLYKLELLSQVERRARWYRRPRNQVNQHLIQIGRSQTGREKYQQTSWRSRNSAHLKVKRNRTHPKKTPTGAIKQKESKNERKRIQWKKPWRSRWWIQRKHEKGKR